MVGATTFHARARHIVLNADLVQNENGQNLCNCIVHVVLYVLPARPKKSAHVGVRENAGNIHSANTAHFHNISAYR